MDYIESNLRKDEKVIVRAKISWLTLVGPVIGLIIGLIVALSLPSWLAVDTGDAYMDATINDTTKDSFSFLGWAVFVVLALPFVKQLIYNLTTHLAVTNKRVIGKVGALKTETIDYPIDKVDNVSFQSSFLGNIFKYASVQIGTTSGEKKNLGAISNAQEFKNKVNDAIETHAAEARAAQAREIASAMGK